MCENVVSAKKWLKVEVNYAVKTKLVEQKSDIDKTENLQLRNVKSQVQKNEIYNLEKLNLPLRKAKLRCRKL